MIHPVDSAASQHRVGCSHCCPRKSSMGSDAELGCPRNLLRWEGIGCGMEGWNQSCLRRRFWTVRGVRVWGERAKREVRKGEGGEKRRRGGAVTC